MLHGVPVAETSWPFDAGAGAASGEDRWYKMAPLWAIDGVTLALSSLAVTTLSGRNLQVATGTAWVHGAFYSNDAAISLPIAANASGNPRIDRIVLRRDISANTVVAAVLQGTAAASPAAPALTLLPTSIWEVPLAQYRAESGFTNTDPLKLSDERHFTGADALDTKGIGVYANSADRTLRATPVAGSMSWLQDLGRFDLFNGSVWIALNMAPQQADVATAQTTTSTTYTDLTTPGPAITVALVTGQKVALTISSKGSHSTGTSASAFASYAVSGASTVAAADLDGYELQTTSPVTGTRRSIYTAVATGNHTFTMKYRVVNSGTGSWSNRRIIVESV